MSEFENRTFERNDKALYNKTTRYNVEHSYIHKNAFQFSKHNLREWFMESSGWLRKDSVKKSTSHRTKVTPKVERPKCEFPQTTANLFQQRITKYITKVPNRLPEKENQISPISSTSLPTGSDSVSAKISFNYNNISSCKFEQKRNGNKQELLNSDYVDQYTSVIQDKGLVNQHCLSESDHKNRTVQDKGLVNQQCSLESDHKSKTISLSNKSSDSCSPVTVDQRPFLRETKLDTCNANIEFHDTRDNEINHEACSEIDINKLSAITGGLPNDAELNLNSQFCDGVIPFVPIQCDSQFTFQSTEFHERDSSNTQEMHLQREDGSQIRLYSLNKIDEQRNLEHNKKFSEDLINLDLANTLDLEHSCPLMPFECRDVCSQFTLSM